MTTLNAEQRSHMRKTLLAAGEKTRGLDDAKLEHTYNQLHANNPQTAQKAEQVAVQPQPEPTPHVDASSADKLAAALKDIMGGMTTPLDENRVVELIKAHSAPQQHQTTHIVRVERPDLEPVTISGAHPVLPKLIDVLAVGENAYLVGGAGSGKTTLARQAADALGMDFHFTGKVPTEYKLTGFVDANGTYHRTPLRDAVEHGGLFLLDEVDGSNPNEILAFNALIENGVITFPDNVSFEVDKEKTVFIAAANTVGTGANRSYVGRYEQDRAFLDRFVQLEVGYDDAIEIGMAKEAWLKAGGAEDALSSATQWASVVQEFRALVEERKILVLATPRATRQGAALLARGWEVADVKDAVLFKHLSADQRAQLNV